MHLLSMSLQLTDEIKIKTQKRRIFNKIVDNKKSWYYGVELKKCKQKLGQLKEPSKYDQVDAVGCIRIKLGPYIFVCFIGCLRSPVGFFFSFAYDSINHQHDKPSKVDYHS